MNANVIINIVLVLILIFMVASMMWTQYRIKKAATKIDNEQFRENSRKAQVIDVRDKVEFSRAHIMGARNIPLLQLKESGKSLRKDQPIYLYDNDQKQVGRAALTLKKLGYTNLFILKTGFKGWDGKVKGK